MIKICFICHGSICRSPMARFIFQNEINKRGLNSNFIVDAKAVSREEIGNDMYPPAKECLRKNNIPFVKTSSQQVTKDDYDYYDYLIIMDSSNKYLLERIVGNDKSNKIRSLLSFKGLMRDIKDPWYTSNFQECYNDICYGIEGFLDFLLK